MAYYGKIATLPIINQKIKIFGIKTDLSAGLTSIPLTIIKVMYGSVTLLATDTVIVGDSNPVGLVCLVTDPTIPPSTATVLVYFNAISVPTLPDNFSRLVQKIPKGVFEEVSPATFKPDGTIDNIGDPQGWDFKARSELLDDYYNNAYLPLYDNLYSKILTSDLIYEYTSNTNFTSNVTTSTLPQPAFNSVYPNELAMLMASVFSVGLNQYDLSLFVSRYIWYRTGIQATVLLNTLIDNFQYMRLSPELPTPTSPKTDAYSWSVLAPEPITPLPVNPRNQPIVISEIQDTPDGLPNFGWSKYYSTTAPQLIGSAYLAAEGYQPILNNLRWYIISDNNNLKYMRSELQALINNISRGDIGNTLYINHQLPFGSKVLVQKGFTYKLDPRFVQALSAIRYTKDDDFPQNIALYQLGANNG